MGPVCLQEALRALRVPSFLELLPGEVRNQIYENCILDARISTRSQPRVQPEEKPLSVSVLPRWQGSGRFHLEGIKALPLLFVNKQVHQEIVSLVYSKVDKVSIGGYLLQYPNEDPTQRWKCVYSLLKKRPYIQRFATQVKIVLPSLRDDLIDGHWRSLGLKPPQKPASDTGDIWKVIPGLMAFLETFESLEKLHVVIQLRNSAPPNFQQLLPLYALYRIRTTFEFSKVHIDNFNSNSLELDWTIAWSECLFKNGKS